MISTVIARIYRQRGETYYNVVLLDAKGRVEHVRKSSVQEAKKYLKVRCDRINITVEEF